MTDRRRSILDAAAAVILAKGYDAATIADIRAASGASTGSIYHAFGSKEGVAVALATRAMRAWEAAVAASIRSDTPEGLIRATVEGLVRWGLADPIGFLVLDRMRGITERGDGGEPLAQLLDQGRRESGRALAAMAAKGEVRDLDWPLLQALILGPAYEFLRADRFRQGELDTDRIATVLADAAWAAVART